MANTTSRSSSTIHSKADFQPTPAGEAERWSAEMAAADKEVDKWEKNGQRIVDRFLDKRSRASSGRGGYTSQTRLNLFTANVQTLRCMLFGQIPSVDAKRRNNDPHDDPARVAANILERILNNDIYSDDDTYCDTLRYALDDRLIVGLGCARVRYEVEHEDVEVPPIPGPDGTTMAEGYTEQRMVREDAPVDYVHWRDIRWSPARVWGEVRWIGFREHLTKDQMKERFGEDVAKTVPYGSQRRDATTTQSDAMEFDAWQRCEVWEIWCKEDRKVYWWVKGYSRVLDVKEDFLELTGFFPCPQFMLANPTTSSLLPRPDFDLHRDLYNEIDFVSTRIERLERAVKAVGVYDKSATGVQRMLQEGFDNDLIPVDNWAGFTEKGGVQGTIQWMPLQDIVGALTVLRDYRKELIDLLYQVTGLSDILRGASTQPNVTATEQGLKAKYASVRVTALQETFAEFASELQRLRAEVITKHFDDQTIIQRSGIMRTPDAPLVPQAMQLLRSDFTQYRVEIEPDSIARADYTAMKNDRVEYLTAVGKFIGAVLPLAQQIPAAGPALVEMIRWASTGFRGGDQMESVLDQMLGQMQQQQQGQQGQGQQKPSEEEIKAKATMQVQQQKAQAKMAEIQAKAQADMAKIQAEMRADMQKAQQEAQLDSQREANQAYWNVAEERQKAAIRAREAEAKVAMMPRPKQ
jgi:hypothetical protein